MPLFEIVMPRSGADPLGTALIRDGFSWGAALMPPAWALLHLMWLEMFGWFVITLLISVTGLFIGGAAAFWLYVLFALWIGFAASDLRIAALTRRGHVPAGARIAKDEFLAEHDWLEEKLS